MKRTVIILIVIVIATVGVVFAWTKLAVASSTDKTQYKIGKAEIGMVKKTVSATGALHAWTTVDIKSKAGGRVDALLVDVGSVVKKGQVLCKIDPTDTLLSFNQAKADINAATSKIGQTQETWELQKQQSELAVETARAAEASAEANLAAAQARLAEAKEQCAAQPDLTNATIASAKANHDSAEKQLTQMLEATFPQDRATAQAAYDQAQANLVNTDANIGRQRRLLDKGYVSEQVVDTALAARDVAKAQVDSAKRKLDTLKQEQDAMEAAERAKVKQAEAQWKNAVAAGVDIRVREGARKEAEANVNQFQKAVITARKNLALAKANVATNAIRQADIAQARATKMRADASFANAQATLDQTTVRSPSDGVVLVKYVDVGTLISSALSFAAAGNSIIQIGDVTRMYVDVTVDETDIANVSEGQAVDVSIEAFPGVPFEGKVTRIDPQAVVEANVTNIHVRVEIDNSDVKFKLLKPGMNTTCEFVKDKKENVLSVPSEAVRTDDTGHFVEIAVGGKPMPGDPKASTPPDPNTLVEVKVVKRRVEIGLEGNDSDEITSGLKEGNTIITQKIEPVVQQAGGAIGGGFGPRGGGGGRGR